MVDVNPFQACSLARLRDVAARSRVCAGTGFGFISDCLRDHLGTERTPRLHLKKSWS